VSVAFDTLRFARALRDKAKLTSEQAEGIAEAFAEAIDEQLVTKGDRREFGAEGVRDGDKISDAFAARASPHNSAAAPPGRKERELHVMALCDKRVAGAAPPRRRFASVRSECCLHVDWERVS